MKVTGFLNDDMTVTVGCEQVQFPAGHEVGVYVQPLLAQVGNLRVDFGDGCLADLSLRAILKNIEFEEVMRACEDFGRVEPMV